MYWLIASSNKRNLKRPDVCVSFSPSAQPVDLLPKTVEGLQRDPARSGLTRKQMLAIHQQLEEQRCSK